MESEGNRGKKSQRRDLADFHKSQNIIPAIKELNGMYLPILRQKSLHYALVHIIQAVWNGLGGHGAGHIVSNVGAFDIGKGHAEIKQFIMRFNSNMLWSHSRTMFAFLSRIWHSRSLEFVEEPEVKISQEMTSVRPAINSSACQYPFKLKTRSLFRTLRFRTECPRTEWRL